MVTGVSGSGKSSLAFDTIYAEGQRRYVESLSAYARQFLERMEKPDVDEISGIAPAVAIPSRRNSTRNPRSTVATATEIYDYLRLLLSRAAVQTFCIKCGALVRRDNPDDIADKILSLAPGRRFYVLYELRIAQAQPAGARRGAKKKPAPPSQEALRNALSDIQKRGFNPAVSGWPAARRFSSPETLLEVDFTRPVYVVVDRLAVSPESRARLVDSIEICYREAGGEAILEFVADGAVNAAEQRLVFNERFECKSDGTLYQEPRNHGFFSFNNPYGACPRCQGFGNTIDFDLNLVVPDPSKSLDEGAIEPWSKPRYKALFQELKKWAPHAGYIPPSLWRHLTADQRKSILEGDPENDFDGVKGFFTWLERKKYKLHVRVFLSRYRGYATCPECGGTRLRAEARAVRVAGKSITEICTFTVKEARAFFGGFGNFRKRKAKIADKIFEEVRSRLQFLDEVGLDYLSLDRLTSTLSGEQECAADSAGNVSGLAPCRSTVRVLPDEPSIGLHPARHTQRLIDIFEIAARPPG